MITPQELQSKKFEKAVFGGYDMSQVDDFLDNIIGDYTALYKENIALKGKMKVLVDKVEEYRSVDDEIRKMLYTAQTKSKELIAGAEREAQNIISSARNTAESSIMDMKAEYDMEKEKLKEMKAETAEYAEKIKAILKTNIEILDKYIEAPPQKDNIPPKGEDYRKASVDTFDFELPKDFIVDKGVDDTREIEIQEENIVKVEITETIKEPEVKETTVDMSTKFFEVELNDKEQTVEEEPKKRFFISGKKDNTEETPSKPKNIFADLKFGKNYSDDDDYE